MINIIEQKDRLSVRSRVIWVPGILSAFAVLTSILAAVRFLQGELPSSDLGWAAVAVLALSGGAAVFVEATAFTFSKTTGCFEWKKRRLLKKHRGSVPLSNVKKARRDLMAGSDGGNIYRIVVETDTVVIPLTRSFGGNEGEMTEVVDRINDFLIG